MFDEERRSAGVIECGFNSKIIPFFKSRGENLVRETGEWNVIGPEANRLGFPMIWSELLKSASFQKTMRRSTPERRGYTIDCWWRKKKGPAEGEKPGNEEGSFLLPGGITATFWTVVWIRYYVLQNVFMIKTWHQWNYFFPRKTL